MNASKIFGIQAQSWGYQELLLQGQVRISGIGRFLLSFTVMASVNLLHSPQIFAQTVDIPFSGVVPGTCFFDTPHAGTLQLNGAGTAFNSVGATSGSVSMTCTQGANLSVSAPRYIGGDGSGDGDGGDDGFVFAGSNSTVSVSSDDADQGLAVTNNDEPLPLTVAGTKRLTVDMSATSNGKIASGLHHFTVTLTVIP